MGLFEAIGELATMPIRCLGEVAKDLSDNGDGEMDQMNCIFTLGLSSVARGIGKTIEKSVDKLD